MAKKKSGSTRPYNLFLNQKGMDERGADLLINPDAARDIKNLHMARNGVWTNYNRGYDHFSAEIESGERIDSIGTFRDAAGTDFLVAGSNGKVKQINPSTGAVVGDVTTGLTAGLPVDYQVFKGLLFMAEGSTDPLKWTGSGAANAAGGFPIGPDDLEKPTIVETFQNRLLYACFQDSASGAMESHLAISDDLDPETFTVATTNDTDGFVLQVNPGDGEVITAVKTAYVPNQDQTFCIIFKTSSIYALTGSSPNPDGDLFTLRQINPQYGCVNNRSAVVVGNDIYFIDKRAIRKLTTVTQSGNMQMDTLGNSYIQDILDDMNLSQLGKCWAFHLPEYQEVWFGIPTGASNEVDRILVHRYASLPDEQTSWSYRDGMTATCMAVQNGTYLTGSNNGYINDWFNNSTYAGVGIFWRYKYPHWNGGTQNQNKKVNEHFIWVLVRETTAMQFEYNWRGGGNKNRKALTKTVPIPDVAMYGEAIYGTDLYAPEDNEGLFKVKVPVYGNGEQIQYEINGTTSELGITFLGMSGLFEFLDYSRSYK